MVRKIKPPRFHTKPLRRTRRRGGSGWRTVRALLTLLIALAIGAIFMHFSQTSGDWQMADTRFTLCADRSSVACVIDGDTIMIGRRKIRITGYNAPEMDGQCPAESALARRSRDAVLDWLNVAPFLIGGGDDPAFDQYGRELRELRRGDEFLADVMIDRGLAQGSGWGTVRGGWCE
ncbi:thermonuclease family protein [Pontixanthobacter sp.]|uniref:thermonuclease family protein n=1 Tax=Pontixanthobacter sp. TaxID=2792078 RepID=UPI003C7DCDB2